MLADKDKISLRQALLVYLILLFSSAVRFIPAYSANIAKQAAYLAPVVSFFAIYPIIFLIYKVFDKYKETSMINIVYLVIGKTAGKILLALYAFWILLLTALFARYYAERLVTTIFVTTNINIFIIIMLVIVAISLKKGFVTIARMNEIIFPLVNIAFLSLMIFLIPEFKIRNITPISYLDIVPVLNASLGTSSLWGYIFFIFFIGSQINNLEELKTQGTYTLLYLAFSTSLLIAMIVGTLGYSITAKAPLPFLAAVKLISVFDILEKIESIVVVVWILTDFILISTFSNIILQLIKAIFDLKDEKPLINIFMILVFFITLFITVSKFDLERFSTDVINRGDIIFTLIIPPIILILGLMKKKKAA